MREELRNIKSLYDDGVNIIKHIKNKSQAHKNTSEMIMISYDFQAGSYIKNVLENPQWHEDYSIACATVLNQLGAHGSILEAGVGEATAMYNIVSKLKKLPEDIFGFDISYSRIKYARHHLKNNNISNSTLFVGDLFNTAVRDNAFDIVYTSNAIEPNGGKEKEALTELYRITGKYLVLFEPRYEFGDETTRAYIQEHGYIKDLYAGAVELGYKIVENKLIFNSNPWSPINMGVMVIEKNSGHHGKDFAPLACPITKAPLKLVRGNYYCPESMLLYPVVDQIPCLLPENAIIATHYLDEL